MKKSLVNNILTDKMHHKDLARVLDIQSECYTSVVPESEESIRCKLEAAPDCCFVACTENQVVAYLIALPWISDDPPMLDAKVCLLPPSPNTLYLHDLAVSLKARGMNIGALLMQSYYNSADQLKFQRGNLIAVQNSASATDSAAGWEAKHTV